MDTFHLSDAQLYLHMWTPAQASAYTSTCAHSHAHATSSAVPPRRMAAPHRIPAERIRRGARRRPKAAHTRHKLVTRAVFHAPMFALNTYAEENACAPNHPRSTPRESARKSTFWRGYMCAQTHAHAHERIHADAMSVGVNV